jgi:hypothetical protein
VKTSRLAINGVATSEEPGIQFGGSKLKEVLHQNDWRPAMTLQIKRIREKNETRISLSGELRCSHLLDLRAEIEQVGQPITLDMDEVDVVDIDGIRFLNECKSLGIQVVNCSPYIREWMLQEKRTGEDEE